MWVLRGGAVMSHTAGLVACSRGCGQRRRRKRRTLEVETGVHKSRVHPPVHTSCRHSLQGLGSVGSGQRRRRAVGGGGARPGGHARPGRSTRTNPPAYQCFRGDAAPPAACRALSEGGSCVRCSKLARRDISASCNRCRNASAAAISLRHRQRTQRRRCTSAGGVYCWAGRPCLEAGSTALHPATWSCPAIHHDTRTTSSMPPPVAARPMAAMPDEVVVCISGCLSVVER